MNKPENEAVNASEENQEFVNNESEQNETVESTENTADSAQSHGNDADKKIADLNDKYLRLYSEFDNYRKRTAREKIEFMKSAGEDVFKAFLPIIDDFERANKANETATDLKAVTDGVNLIYNKMKSSLTSKGLEVIDCVNKTFDSEIMEAITSIPAPSEELKGKVIDCVENGYMLNGKVIRFAKVVIGS